MPTVNFTDYTYYPVLQSTHAEHVAFNELAPNVKSELVPIFELSRRNKASDLTASVEATRQTTGEDPFILDLCHDAAPTPILPRDPARARAAQAQYQRDLAAQQAYNAELQRLLDPVDGFSAWRALTATYPNAIPVLQYTDIATQGRAILRQASALSQGGSSLAIKVKMSASAGAAALVSNILAVLGDPQRLLIIFDCGAARRRPVNAVDEVNQFTADLIRHVELAEAAALNIAFVSSSLTPRNHEGLYEVANLDIPLWLDARQFHRYAFGDYGATIRRAGSFAPPDWRAQPIYPLDQSWLWYRHHVSNDPRGWIDGCGEIQAHAEYNPVPQCWGSDLIARAAAGEIDNIDSSWHWNAAKTNIHITRMVRQIPNLMDDEIGFDDQEG